MIQRRHGGGLERMAVVSRTHGVSDSGIEHVAVSVIDYKNRWTVGDGGRAGGRATTAGGKAALISPRDNGRKQASRSDANRQPSSF